MKKLRDHLHRLALRLPTPRDYWSGISSRFTSPPRKLLLFHRRHGLHEQPTIHHRFVLLGSLSGTAGVIVDGRMHLLAPGRAILIFPHQAHHYAQFRDETISWLFLTFELDDATPVHGLRNRIMALPTKAWEQFMAVAQAMADKGRREAEVAPLAMLLLEACLACAPSAATAAEATTVLSPSPQAIRRAAQFIHAHLGQPFRLAEVARAAGLSESHLRRVFRTTLGMSLGRYARRSRLAHAATLLRESDMNITQVAEAVGFGSVYAFSNAFRKYAQIPPWRYRQRERGKIAVPRQDLA